MALHALCSRGSGGGVMKVEEGRALLLAGKGREKRDEFGRTPLHVLLLSQSPSTREEEEEEEEEGGMEGDLAFARFLIAEDGGGVDLNAQDNWGRTALHWCAEKGRVGMARFLLKSGASPSVLTHHGDTVLLWACKAGESDVARLLISGEGGGGDIDILLRNNRGEAPLDYCTSDEFAFLRKRIEEEGRRRKAEAELEQDRKGQAVAEEGQAARAMGGEREEKKAFSEMGKKSNSGNATGKIKLKLKVNKMKS